MQYYVSSGQVSNGIILTNYDYMSVSSGGTANNTTVSGGYLEVRSGGTANSTTVNFGGRLSIASRGTAAAIVENGGYVEDFTQGANVTYKPNAYSGLVLSERQSASVHSGTTANYTTVKGGQMYVDSGGTANNTTVSGGNLYVFSGGTATDINWTPCVGAVYVADDGYATFVSSYSGVYFGSADQLLSSAAVMNDKTVTGNMYIFTGGTANYTMVSGNYYCSMYVSRGGTANNTTVNSGTLYVCNGGTINSTTINNAGELYVYSGGTANYTTLNSWGEMYVCSGGTADNITVNSGVGLYVSSGGTATNINWTPCAGNVVFVEEGGYATYACSYSGVYVARGDQLLSSAAVMDGKNVTDGMYVFTGGTANSTRVDGFGSMHVYSGGTANYTAVDINGFMYVSSGGTANNTTAYRGSMYVRSGGTANSTTLNHGGFMHLYSGGTVDNILINVGGTMYVDSGGTVDNTTVNRGSIYVSSGGTATNINWTPCVGNVSVADGGYATFVSSYSGVYVGSGEQLLSSAVVMDDKTVKGSMYIFTGGTANRTTLNNGGDLYVRSGGTANSTTVNSYGSMFISSGGTANSTTVNGSGYQNGRLYVSNGGTANNTTVNDGGYMVVASGGTATAIVENGGYVAVADGAEVTFTPNVLRGLVLISYGSATVHSGTTANAATLNAGDLYVYSGGTANYTAVNYGSLYVSSGGTVNSTTVNSDGYMYVSSGGMANSTTVISGGTMYVSSGGTATNIIRRPFVGGSVFVDDGAYVTYAADSGVYYGRDGNLYSSTPSMWGITVKNQESIYVMSGGMANNTTVNSGGYMVVSSGGTASNTTVNSGNWTMVVSSGGIVDSITVNSGGRLIVSSGGKVTGRLQIVSGANVTFYDSILDFDISEQTADYPALVNDLSLIQNMPDFTITVSDTQKAGVYTLAGVVLWKSRIKDLQGCTVSIGTNEKCYGDLTVNGNALTYKSISYKLTTSNNSLLLTVSAAPVPATVIDDIGAIAIGQYINGALGYDGNVEDYAVFAVGTAGKYQVVGNFGNLNATVTISNGNKTVAQGTIKNGVLTFNQGNPVLLDVGNYSLVLKSSDKGKTASDYTFAVSAKTVFDKGDEDSLSEPGELGSVVEPGPLVEDGWVGFGDESDYLAFTLDHAANLIFDYTATDAAKFTIGQMQSNGKLKSLQTTTLKAGAAASTKALLLTAGDYYLTVQSTNPAKGGDAEYTVTVNPASKFFTKKDDGNNDFLYDAKTKTVNEQLKDADGIEINEGTGDVQIDSTAQNWVGFGDAADYRKITLTSAAKLSFTVTSTDAAKFTIYQLNETKKNNDTTYSLKSLQSTTIAAPKAGNGETTVTTKDVLLSEGTYFLAMESTNAAKGGDAEYTVTVNPASKFFTKKDDGSNNWLYNAKEKSVNKLLKDADGIELNEGTGDVQIDDAESNWVGFEDAADYRKITLTSSAKLSFDVTSTDAAKFTIYQLNETTKNNNTTYSLKSLQTTTLSKPRGAEEYSATTKELLLEKGEYYLAVESTNAAKGGNAEYTVGVNQGKSEFFPVGDNTNDTWKAAESQEARLPGEEITGWVGFGDAADFIKFQLAESGQLQLTLNDDTTHDALAGKEIKLTCLDSNGKAVALSSLSGDGVTSKKSLAEGEYYLGITCANVNKFYNTSYSVTIGLLATA